MFVKTGLPLMGVAFSEPNSMGCWLRGSCLSGGFAKDGLIIIVKDLPLREVSSGRAALQGDCLSVGLAKGGLRLLLRTKLKGCWVRRSCLFRWFVDDGLPLRSCLQGGFVKGGLAFEECLSSGGCLCLEGPNLRGVG